MSAAIEARLVRCARHVKEAAAIKQAAVEERRQCVLSSICPRALCNSIMSPPARMGVDKYPPPDASFRRGALLTFEN